MTGSPRIRYLWLKRIALVLLAPLVFFGALEVVLRVVAYGGSLNFFESVEVDGKKFSVENLHFGRRFFREHVPRAPGWNLIPEPRDGVARIAVIGESAAQGYPLQKLGLASVLEGVLEIQYPGRGFDFINATMTSVNSHVLEQIVPEIVAQKPDVTVIYTGNNEVVGPYGPGTPFTTWMANPASVALDKHLRATKTYRLMEGLLSPATQKAPTWGGFEMFSELRVPNDSPELAVVYAAFERNLESIVTTLLASGSRVVLCTVAVNLASWGPSGTVALPAGSREADLVAQAKQQLEEGRPEPAIEALQEAEKLAPGSAEIYFLLGRSYLDNKQPTEARAFFAKARDLDEHRFRADSRINDVIREVAARYAARGVVLVDADRDLAAKGLPGRREFTEHVHMTFDGMAKLALLVARAVGPLLPQDSAVRHDYTDTDIPELKQRIFFTPFDEIVLNTMAREVGDLDVFKNRAGAQESRQLLAQEEAVLRSSFPFSADQLRRDYALAKSLRPRDSRIDESFAENLLRLGESAEASRAGRRALSRKPNFFPGWLMLANAARKTGNLDAAEKFFRNAMDITPLLPQAWTGLGDIARERGEVTEATDFYEEALRVDASWSAAAIPLAEIQTKNGDASRARRTLEKLARNNPGSPDAAFAQARFYETTGDIAAAAASYERALDLDLGLSPGYYLLFASRHFVPREMRAAFEKYEARLGDSPVLWGNYAWLLATSPDPATRDPAKARALAERAYDLASPKNAHVHRVLAAAHAANGDFVRASAALEQARAWPDLGADLRMVLGKMASDFAKQTPYFEPKKKAAAAD